MGYPASKNDRWISDYNTQRLFRMLNQGDRSRPGSDYRIRYRRILPKQPEQPLSDPPATGLVLFHGRKVKLVACQGDDPLQAGTFRDWRIVSGPSPTTATLGSDGIFNAPDKKAMGTYKIKVTVDSPSQCGTTTTLTPKDIELQLEVKEGVLQIVQMSTEKGGPVLSRLGLQEAEDAIRAVVGAEAYSASGISPKILEVEAGSSIRGPGEDGRFWAASGSLVAFKVQRAEGSFKDLAKLQVTATDASGRPLEVLASTLGESPRSDEVWKQIQLPAGELGDVTVAAKYVEDDQTFEGEWIIHVPRIEVGIMAVSTTTMKIDYLELMDGQSVAGLNGHLFYRNPGGAWGYGGIQPYWPIAPPFPKGALMLFISQQDPLAKKVVKVQ